MGKCNGKRVSPIILLNNGVETSQAYREREALARLDYLDQLKPAGAAPLTAEDLAIFEAALERTGDQFSNYFQHAYMDYCYFFIAAVTDERENAMEKLT